MSDSELDDTLDNARAELEWLEPDAFTKGITAEPQMKAN